MARTEFSLIKTPFINGDEIRESAKPQVNAIRRFLRWTKLMKTSTFNKDGETHEKDEWNYGLIFVIGFLYITVIGLFLAVAIGGAMFYLDMREDARGSETWARKELYDKNKLSYEKCTQNAETLKALILFNQQNGVKTPSELIKIAECPPVADTNKK